MRKRRPKGEWGVVEIQSRGGSSPAPPVWFAYWMELDAPWRVSIEIDPVRAATISPAAWRRARQAFGPPLAIRVIDPRTARRVRSVVPARVTVTVAPDDQRLLEMTAAATAVTTTTTTTSWTCPSGARSSDRPPRRAGD